MRNVLNRLLCRAGLHDYTVVEDPETLYGKAGILMGSINTGSQVCLRRCGVAHPVYKFGSLFNAGEWRRYDERITEAAIREDFMPMKELSAWRLKQNIAKVKAVDGTNCSCGRPWQRVKSDHNWEWWHSHYCNHCYKYSGVWYKQRKSEKELVPVRARAERNKFPPINGQK